MNNGKTNFSFIITRYKNSSSDQLIDISDPSDEQKKNRIDLTLKVAASADYSFHKNYPTQKDVFDCGFQVLEFQDITPRSNNIDKSYSEFKFQHLSANEKANVALQTVKRLRMLDLLSDFSRRR